MFILSVDIDYFTSFGKILLPTGEVAELVESGTLLMCYAALKPHRGFESLPLRRAIAVRFITIYILRKEPGMRQQRWRLTVNSAKQREKLRQMRELFAQDPESVELAELIEKSRPRTRGECVNGFRPCFYVSCRHNLLIEFNPKTGTFRENFSDYDIDELPATCSLDVAELGGLTLEEVGDVLYVTRERVRQIECQAVKKMAPKLAEWRKEE